MSYLNVNYSFVEYSDATSPNNPKVKTADISRSDTQVCVSYPGGQTFSIGPNEVVELATTSRSIAWDNTTQLHFQRYLAGSDNLRILWTGTGTAPAYRVNRNIGGSATTSVSITRVTPYVARITNVGGTAWTPGAIQAGDIIKFERNTDSFTSPLSYSNLGQAYTVQTATSTSIDFIDNGQAALDAAVVLGSDYAFAVRVYSASGVKIGDVLELPNTSNAHPSNQGKYTVTDVSPDYLEIVSPLGLDETILYSSSAPTAVAYDRLIGFLHARSVATGGFKLRFDDNTGWTKYSPLSGEAFFLGSVTAYRIQATNEGPNPVVLSVQYSTVT